METPSALANHYQCRDGRWFLMALHNEARQLGSFLKAIDAEYLVQDPRFATPLDRRANHRVLTAILDEIFATRDLSEWRPILEKAGVTAEGLACGPHPPFDEQALRLLAEAGLEPRRLHNNCSGKHAGMMMLARARGWDPAGYERPGHPVQQRMLAEIARWSRMPVEAIGLGTDGCGVACFALPLRQMALSFATFAAAARAGERGPSQVFAAMTAHPEMVAGRGRLCTALMRQAAGRLFAKVGAEGVYCVGVPGAELGIALKVEDGAARAVAPAILAVLRELDLISEDDFGALHSFAYADLLNTRGEPVGQIRPAVRLRIPDA